MSFRSPVSDFRFVQQNAAGFPEVSATHDRIAPFGNRQWVRPVDGLGKDNRLGRNTWPHDRFPGHALSHGLPGQAAKRPDVSSLGTPLLRVFREGPWHDLGLPIQ